MAENQTHTISVVLSEAEYKALAYVAVSPEAWAENAVKERCRWAMIEIFQIEVQRMVADPSTSEIPADMEAVVLASELPSAAEVKAQMENETTL